MTTYTKSADLLDSDPDMAALLVVIDLLEIESVRHAATINRAREAGERVLKERVEARAKAPKEAK